MTTPTTYTTVEENAWAVADAAAITACGVSVTAFEARFREEFPQVKALYGVQGDTDRGARHFGFDAVLVGTRIRRAEEIKPENRRAITEALSTLWRGSDHQMQTAIDLAITSEGLFRAPLPAEVTPVA